MRWSWRWIGSSQTRESAGFKFVPPRNCARVIPSLVPRSTWTRTPTLLSRLAQNHSSIFLTRRHINSKKKVHLEYVAIRLVRATTKHRLQHTPQCLTQHSPRRVYRPLSSAVLESRSTPSHLRPRTCLKRSSPSRTVPWSGTLWTGAIAWELLVCLAWRIRDNPSQTTN